MAASIEELVEAAVLRVRDVNGFKVVYVPDGLSEAERKVWRVEQQRRHPWHHIATVRFVSVHDGNPEAD